MPAKETDTRPQYQARSQISGAGRRDLNCASHFRFIVLLALIACLQRLDVQPSCGLTRCRPFGFRWASRLIF